MNKKQLLLVCVAIVAYTLGVFGYASATYAHVWHLFAIPTYQVTSVAFVVANLAVTLLYGAKHGYSLLMIAQGLILSFIMVVAHSIYPMCTLMAQGLLVPTVGIICMGLLAKLLTKPILMNLSYPR